MRRTRPSETEQHKTSSPPPPPLLTPSSQHCLLSPATVFSWVYSAAHSYSTIPSISTLLPHLFLLVCTPSPSFFPPWGFSLRFITFSFFCTPVPPFKVHVLLHSFYFALFCCYHLLPSTLACICNTCKSLFKDDTLLFSGVCARVCWWSVSCPCFVSCHIEETQQWWEV